MIGFLRHLLFKKHTWEWRRCCWPHVEGRGWAAHCPTCGMVYPISDNKRWRNPMPKKPNISAQLYMQRLDEVSP